MNSIRIGTAGWALARETVALFPGTGTHLERYARGLNAVEINSTFNHSHRRSTYERWAACTPMSFRFSVKLPKEITHVNQLSHSESELDQFLEETRGLGDKLGPILVQLPPSFAWCESVSRRFFSEFRARHNGSIVCEPRHNTWFTDEADCQLKEFQIGRVAADPAVVPSAAVPGGSMKESYYRWHGSPRVYYTAYDEQALRRLCATLQVPKKGTNSVWCIFDNTADNKAIFNALALCGMLDSQNLD